MARGVGGVGEALNIDLPTIAEICFVNRSLIEATSGRWEPPDNLLNRGVLEYALDAATASLGGAELHPGVTRKAASIGWAIARRHPFFDSNKRTAAESTFLTLRLNSRMVSAESSEVVDVMLSIAEHKIDFEDWVEWLERHSSPSP
jgi:death-on-curing protein